MNYATLIHIATNLRTRYQGKGHGGYCIYEDDKVEIGYDDYFPNVHVNLKDADKTCVYSRSGHGIVSVYKPGKWESYISALVPKADAAKAEKEAIQTAKEKRERERCFGRVSDDAFFEENPR